MATSANVRTEALATDVAGAGLDARLVAEMAHGFRRLMIIFDNDRNAFKAHAEAALAQLDTAVVEQEAAPTKTHSASQDDVGREPQGRELGENVFDMTARLPSAAKCNRHSVGGIAAVASDVGAPLPRRLPPTPLPLCDKCRDVLRLRARVRREQAKQRAMALHKLGPLSAAQDKPMRAAFDGLQAALKSGRFSPATATASDASEDAPLASEAPISSGPVTVKQVAEVASCSADSSGNELGCGRSYSGICEAETVRQDDVREFHRQFEDSSPRTWALATVGVSSLMSAVLAFAAICNDSWPDWIPLVPFGISAFALWRGVPWHLLTYERIMGVSSARSPPRE